MLLKRSFGVLLFACAALHAGSENSETQSMPAVIAGGSVVTDGAGDSDTDADADSAMQSGDEALEAEEAACSSAEGVGAERERRLQRRRARMNLPSAGNSALMAAFPVNLQRPSAAYPGEVPFSMNKHGDFIYYDKNARSILRVNAVSLQGTSQSVAAWLAPAPQIEAIHLSDNGDVLVSTAQEKVWKYPYNSQTQSYAPGASAPIELSVPAMPSQTCCTPSVMQNVVKALTGLCCLPCSLLAPCTCKSACFTAYHGRKRVHFAPDGSLIVMAYAHNGYCGQRPCEMVQPYLVGKDGTTRALGGLQGYGFYTTSGKVQYPAAKGFPLVNAAGDVAILATKGQMPQRLFWPGNGINQAPTQTHNLQNSTSAILVNKVGAMTPKGDLIVRIVQGRTGQYSSLWVLYKLDGSLVSLWNEVAGNDSAVLGPLFNQPAEFLAISPDGEKVLFAQGTQLLWLDLGANNSLL